MAWISKDARDVPPDYVGQICHRNRDFKSVICILCDGGFCKSEFSRRVLNEGRGFFVSRHLVVCAAHVNITYDVLQECDNSGITDVEQLILARKLLLLKKQHINIEKGLNTTQDVDFMAMDADDDDAASVASDRSKKRKYDGDMDTECVSCQVFLSELNSEKKLNCELMKHNDELREHNKLLRTTAAESYSQKSQYSYSNVVKTIPKKQEFSRLLIKPKSNFNGDALKLVQNKVATKTNAKVLRINKAGNGSIFIKCNSAQDSDDILGVLNDNNCGLTASVCEKKNPQIRITNISADLDKQELEADITKRNNLPAGTITVVHQYKQRNKNNAVLAEVTSDVYAMIMRTKSVFVGFENCKVYDSFNINRCKNCCGYNHSIKRCKEHFHRPQACFKCSESHDPESCTSQIKKCINCISANKYLKKARSIDHSADDVNLCESYKIRWEQCVNDTNYPWKPDPPFKSSSNATSVVA